MRKPIVLVATALLAGGCVVVPTVEVYRPAPPPPPQPEVVVAAGPVFEAPGVEVVTVEPAFDERVYVYDPGFPPGVYFVDGYYWYGGYRYPHDVFVERYVNVNIRERRFIDVEANRRAGVRIEEQHRQQYARTGGVHTDVAHPEADRNAVNSKLASERRYQQMQRTSAQHTDKY